ncbi:MAG: hypothetical protein ABSF50_22290, partial [Burkholderiaceae bacterium]
MKASGSQPGPQHGTKPVPERVDPTADLSSEAVKSASIEEAARLAMTQFEAGRLAEAETICLRILEQVPEHPEAL